MKVKVVFLILFLVLIFNYLETFKSVPKIPDYYILPLMLFFLILAIGMDVYYSKKNNL